MEQAIQSLQSFFKRKDVVISAHRYGIDAMGAMAQGLFASLLIGTIIKAAMRRQSQARPWPRPSATRCTRRSWCCSA